MAFDSRRLADVDFSDLFGVIGDDREVERAVEGDRSGRVAVGVMGLVFAASVFFGLPGYVLAIQALCLGGAACFILTRPS